MSTQPAFRLAPIAFGRHHDHHPGSEPIHNAPDRHLWAVVGDETLFLCHLIMGWMQGHNYEVVLEVTVPKDVRTLIKNEQKKGTSLFLANRDAQGDPKPSSYQLHTIPDLQSGRALQPGKGYHFIAEIWDYFPEKPSCMNWPYPDGSSTIGDVLVTVRRVVHYRHVNLNVTSQRFESYVLFGRGKEAHVYHNVVGPPDYDHVATLKSSPEWLQPAQLEAGVFVSVPGLPWSSDRTHCESPFRDASEHEVLYHGIESYRVPPASLECDPPPKVAYEPVPPLKIEVDRTVWFSTRVVNYPCEGPCGGLGDVPTPAPHPKNPSD